EPSRGGARQRTKDVDVHLAVPGHHGARSATAPATVDEPVDLVHVEPAHLGKAPLASDHARGMRLPVDDVRESVLDRPPIPRGGTRHRASPVRRAEPPDKTIQLGDLASGPRKHGFTRVTHIPGTSCHIPREWSRERSGAPPVAIERPDGAWNRARSRQSTSSWSARRGWRRSAG